MSYSFELSGTAEQQKIAAVRDEIDDVTNVVAPVEGTDYFVSDARILRRLTAVADEATTDINRALLAAASCLDTLATNQAYVLKKKSTLGEDMDGPAVADSIRDHAKALRTRVTNSEARIASEAATAVTIGIPEPGTVAIDNYYTP